MAKLTENQQKHIDNLKEALAKYKEENPEAEVITMTELRKQTKLGKGRIKDTIRRGKMEMEVVFVDNFSKEGREDGEVRQYQVRL